MRTVIRLLLGLVLVGASSGCIHIKTNITGTITRDGQPLVWESDEGTLEVIFVPEDRTKSDPIRAITDRDHCSYRIGEIPAGKYLVAIHQFEERHRDVLANKYDPHYSPLRFEVTDDNQVINIDLPKELPK